MKAYSAAWKVHSSTGAAAALPLFKRAIEIDPKFAMAHASLGRMYGDLGESDLSAESTSKAYQLRDRASDAEKFFITASYEMQVTGNLEKAQQTCELWAQTYPRDAHAPRICRATFTRSPANMKRRSKKARKAIELDPDFAIGYDNLACNYVYLDRLGEAENTLQRASERKLEIDEFFMLRYDIAFLKGDQAGMEREAALGPGNPERKTGSPTTRLLSWHIPVTCNRPGGCHSARWIWPDRRPSGRGPALYEAGAALWEAFFGNAPEARQSAMAALELSKDRDVEYGAAFALALSGDSPRAQTLANDLEKRFPEDTSVRFSYLPALRALLALNHGEPAKAIELLQVAVPYELGAPPSSFHGFFGALYPVYVRGEAYLAAHQGAEAAAEFQKILDHRGIVVSDPIGALAHLQLGRAFALSGDKTKAKSCLPGFPHPLERRRPRHPDPQASQGGIRQVKVALVHERTDHWPDWIVPFISDMAYRPECPRRSRGKKKRDSVRMVAIRTEAESGGHRRRHSKSRA